MSGLLLIALCCACRRSPRDIVLWVWERPEDLSRLPPRTSVAVLLRSVEMRGDGVEVRPRLQPLKTPPGTTAIGVVRVDADPKFAGSTRQRDVLVRAAAELPGRFSVASVQIDFDALESQRTFYKDVLTTVRSQLPSNMKLSITALASWCLDDPWIRNLPIDEAVPMLFQMGPDREHVVSYLRAGGDFKVALCRHSAGVSLDEPIWRLPGRRRLFVFSPRGWSPRTLELVDNLRSTP